MQQQMTSILTQSSVTSARKSSQSILPLPFLSHSWRDTKSSKVASLLIWTLVSLLCCMSFISSPILFISFFDPSTVIDSILFYSLRFHSVPRRFIPFIQSYMLVFNHSFSIDGLMAGWIDWFIDSLMNQLVGWFFAPLIRWFVQQVLLLTSSKANAQWSDINGVLKGCIKIVLFVVLSVILASKW